jgi:hypothetical protein
LSGAVHCGEDGEGEPLRDGAAQLCWSVDCDGCDVQGRYGPTIAAYRNIAAGPARTAALEQELANLARRHDRGTRTTVMDWEYLLLTARKQP